MEFREREEKLNWGIGGREGGRDQSRWRESERRAGVSMIGENQRMRFFALRAPTSKAFGGMPLHNFTLNIIQISERERESACACEREDGDERDVKRDRTPSPLLH